MTLEESFGLFWASYPRRVAKAEARRAWAKLNPSPALLETILKALEWQKRLEQWRRDGGQFCPHPASWIRGERWEDEPELVKPEPVKREITPCAHAGCQSEGVQIFGWRCQVHYLQSKPVRA